MKFYRRIADTLREIDELFGVVSGPLLLIVLILVLCWLMCPAASRADDETTAIGTPVLYIGCNRYSPAWKRVRAEIGRDDWIVENYAVVLEERSEFREPMIRFSRHDTWKPWPKPAECRMSPFATSGMATIWIRPELESYASGLAYRHYWEPPFPVIPVIAPVEDDHIAPLPAGESPVPPDADLPRGE